MAAVVVSVERRPGEDDERFIRRFLKKARKEGILREVQERRSYKTKSQKRREKHLRAVHRKRKDSAKSAKWSEE